MMSHLKMGVFNLGINGVLLSNSPPDSCLAHGFLIPQGPISRISLSSRAKRIWGFDARKQQSRIINALANGEMDACSTNNGFLEKELKFSPTFDDYVKVMESVRTDRSQNSSSDADGYTSKRRSITKNGSKLVRLTRNAKTNNHDSKEHSEEVGLIEGRRDKDFKGASVAKSRRHDSVKSSASGWGLVEGILEKAIVGRSGERISAKSGNIGKDCGFKDRRRSSSYVKSNHNGEHAGDGHFKKKEVGSGSYFHHSSTESSKGKWNRDFANNITEERYISRIHQRKDEHIYKIKMGDYEGHKSSLERKTSARSKVVKNIEEPVVAFESNSFHGTSTRSFHEESVTHKNKVEDGNCSASDRRETKGVLRRSEIKTAEMDTKQKAHMNPMEGNINKSISHDAKEISYREVLEPGVTQSHVRFHDGATEKELASRAIKMDGRSYKNNSGFDNGIGKEIDVTDHEDIAAFRSFEVFTDIKNRPRVLRMELEERIEKLAKQLNATDINMPAWQFSKMMHGAKIKFTDHSILRVVQILGKLGNWKRALQVVEWLHSRDRFNSYKSRYIYTSVLDVLGKAKRPIEALNIFYAMRQELSSYPDLAAYHCIACILGQAGLMKELFDVIDCMRRIPEKKFRLGPLQQWDPRLEPDLVIYNAVLNACVQQKQWEGAFWVWQQLKQHWIKPSNTTYGLSMEVMFACGKYNLVHEFFRKVEKTSIPGVLNFKVLINTLWREGKIDEAVLVVNDMERRGIVGTASLYYDLARCLCSAGRCQEALLQIDKICKVAKKPLVVTYTGLIQACLDSGSVENGAYIFNQMQKFCSPNTVTCNIMLKSYVEHGMFEEAKELFHKILDDSHHINTKFSSSQKAIPDKYTFNTMIEACAAGDKWDDFEFMYQEMLRHGFHFDARRHLRMILDAFRAGKDQVLEVTWEHLVRHDRAPPPPIIKERFCLKLEEGDHMAAIACIDIHHMIESRDFSEKSWLRLIKSKGDRFKQDTIVMLASELRDQIDGGDRTHMVYKNLLTACKELVSFTKGLADIRDHHKTLLYDLQLRS